MYDLHVTGRLNGSGGNGEIVPNGDISDSSQVQEENDAENEEHGPSIPRKKPTPEPVDPVRFAYLDFVFYGRSFS